MPEMHLMKKKLATPFLMLLILLCFSTAGAQGFPWEDFERHTLQELVKINEAENADDLKRYPDKGQFVFRGNIMPSVVRVIYTGKSKSIANERKKFIELWAGTYSQTPNYARLFQQEFLFKEGVDEYWLPVQGPVAKYFDVELKKDDTVDVYLIRPGGLRIKGKESEWIFLVEEFQKPKGKEWPSP
jgi:hypothetical protein